MTEKEVQNRLLTAVFTNGRLWRNNVGTAYWVKGDHYVRYGCGGKGAADILGLINGKFIALECKSEKAKLSPDQEDFLQTVEHCGGYTKVVRPEDVDAVLSELFDMDRGLDP